MTFFNIDPSRAFCVLGGSKPIKKNFIYSCFDFNLVSSMRWRRCLEENDDLSAFLD